MMTTIKRDLKHYYQPTGNTCGPTCLYMILDYVQKPSILTIKEIADICGTDWIVGTPPDKLKIGLKSLDLKYIEHINPKNPYSLIKQNITNGNIPILRTITKNIPHWIIVNGFSSTFYTVLDSWLGKIKYSEQELDDIWSLRNYQFFEIIISI